MSQTVLSSNLTDSKPVNLLPNGGFEQWNNGTSWNQNTVIAGVTPIVDGWLFQPLNSTFTITRESTIVDTGRYSVKVNNTVSPSGSKVSLFYQFDNAAAFRGRVMSLNVRVWANSASKVRADVYESGTHHYTSYHTGDSTWQTLTVTLTVGNGATYLYVYIGQPDSTTDYGVCTWYVDSASLAFSSAPVPYVPETTEVDDVKIGNLATAQSNLQNLLDNGSFAYGQKYNGLVSNPVAGTVVVDRWKILLSTTGTQPTFSYQLAGSGVHGRSIRYNCTSAGTGSVNDDRFANQVMEDTGSTPNVLRLRGQYLSLSAWMMSNTATAGIKIQYGSGLFASAYHSGGGAWEYLTVSVLVDSSATVLAAGAFVSPLVTCDVWLADMMWVIGATPMPFYPTNPATELVRCQRYYQTVGRDFATSNMFLVMKVKSAGEANGPVQLPIVMAATPTITFVGSTSFQVEDVAGSLITTTGMSYAALNPRGGRVQALWSGGSLVGGQSTLLFGSSSAYIAYEV